ncbi:MAG TPA: sugar O-acetyltransferase [Longimicrobium sp.]|nr:sugar O-acetyltransferase [Longimicrobium sp.]
MTEMEKMLAGELYDAQDPQLVAERRRARGLLRALNALRDEERDARLGIIRELVGAAGEGVWIEPPFFCDYGGNIHLGARVFFNFNCVVLDVARVTIGSDTKFGPAVQIYTATHPLHFQERRAGLEAGKPVTIGSDVWVGGGAIILPGVTIGHRSVIGAGSVVTRDVPDGVFAAGNPCRVVRLLEPYGRHEHPLSAPHEGMKG